MRYRNYGKRNNSFGNFLAYELYKGVKQNQKNTVSTNNLTKESHQGQIINDVKEPTIKTPKTKRNIPIFVFICILCVTVPFLSSHLDKQNIIKQVENISEKSGLKNVEVTYKEKNTEYDWHYVIIKCSNFDGFSFEEMQNIKSIIKKDLSSKNYSVFIDSFVSKKKEYKVYDDIIYINGEEFIIEKEDEEDKTEKTFRYWQGMNGSWTYRCEKKCDETCKNCRGCIKGRENFGAECTFQYGASHAIGWIGCPLCGDVDYEYWHDWYEENL